MMATWRDARKWMRYFTDKRSFTPVLGEPPSAASIAAALSMRGENRPPAIFLHGVMPRSGTVYVGELLRLHPGIHAYPRELWELPILERTNDLEHIQAEFLWSYVQNKEKLGSRDFLPLFGSSIIAFLSADLSDSKRILMKVSGVQYLDRFFDLFPHESLILLVRDGRDVVHSTVQTWPQIRFWMACIRWSRAAKMALYVKNHSEGANKRFAFARFEDAVDNPGQFVAAICETLGLDVSEYPFREIEALPIRGSSSLSPRTEVDWEPMEKREPFRPVAHWRKWSAYRRLVFKVIAGDALKEIGYGGEAEW